MVIFIIHIILSLGLYALIKFNIIKAETPMIIVVFLVPFIGPMLLLCEHLHHMKLFREVPIGLEGMKVDKLSYKHIRVENSDEDGTIVPLEEAMVVNDPRTRRKLLVEMLENDPRGQAALLQKASLSNDTELTHYATTFMMEIQSDYEKKIADLEEQYRKRKNANTARKLRNEINDYINSNLLSGAILQIFQNKYAFYLKDLIEYYPDNRQYKYDAIMNYIDEKEYTEAEKLLKEYVVQYPKDEKGYYLRIILYHALNDGESLQKVIDEIKAENIYLSLEGRGWFEYWSKETVNE